MPKRQRTVQDKLQHNTTWCNTILSRKCMYDNTRHRECKFLHFDSYAALAQEARAGQPGPLNLMTKHARALKKELFVSLTNIACLTHDTCFYTWLLRKLAALGYHTDDEHPPRHHVVRIVSLMVDVFHYDIRGAPAVHFHTFNLVNDVIKNPPTRADVGAPEVDEADTTGDSAEGAASEDDTSSRGPPTLESETVESECQGDREGSSGGAAPVEDAVECPRPAVRLATDVDASSQEGGLTPTVTSASLSALTPPATPLPPARGRLPRMHLLRAASLPQGASFLYGSAADGDDLGSDTADTMSTAGLSWAADAEEDTAGGRPFGNTVGWSSHMPYELSDSVELQVADTGKPQWSTHTPYELSDGLDVTGASEATCDWLRDEDDADVEGEVGCDASEMYLAAVW